MSPAAPGYREVFDARGGTYDDAMVRWPDARAEELDFALEVACAAAGERLLDVPAGGGYLADRVGPGVTYRALETSVPFAARCRARRLDVVEGPLDGTALPDATTDVVVSLAGTHHEPDLSRLLRAWRRLLRPRGRLVAADVVAGSRPAAFLDGFVGDHNGTGHVATFFGPDLAEQAVAAGLDDVAVVDRTYHWWFEDEAALAAYCTALFGLIDTTAEEVVEAARAGPGIDRVDDRVGLRWGLRAVVGRQLDGGTA